MDLSSRHPRLKALEVALTILGLVGLIVVLSVAMFASGAANLKYCTGYGLKRPDDPYVLALVGLGGFIVGRLLGHVRRWIHGDPAPLHAGVRTEPLLQGLLALALLVAGVALLYESFGLEHYTSAPPITAYVRCAAAGQVGLTATIAFIIFVLLGGWLWRPTDSAWGLRVSVGALVVWGVLALALAVSGNSSVAAIRSDAGGYSGIGFALVSGVIFSFPIVTSIVDLDLTRHNGFGVGHYVNGFTAAYPWFAGILGVAVGAMIAHFFLGLVGIKAILHLFGA
jgi:uncharacterized membrane protein YidH (DUF202 family)